MKTTKILYQLIHSLSKGEKRNFKLFYSKYKRTADSNSIKLFDVINSLSTYDQEKIQYFFTNNNIKSNLSYEKHKLQQMILDFLANQIKIDDPIYELNTLYNQILILINKQQWSLAIKLLEQGIKIAEKNHVSLHLYSFYRMRLSLMVWEEQYNAKTKDFLINKIDINRQDINAYTACFLLYTKITHLTWFDMPSTLHHEGKFTWLEESPYFQNENKVNSFDARLYLYDTKATYYEIKKDVEKATLYQKKILDLFEEYPHFIINQLLTFVGYHINYVRALLFANQVSQAAQHLEKIKEEIYPKYKKNFTKEISAMYQYYQEIMTLDILQAQHNYEAIYKSTFKNELGGNETRRVETLTFSIISCFALSKYQEGIDTLQILEESSTIDNHKEEYFGAKIYGFLCHYELHNQQLLTSFKDGIYYYSRKHKLNTSYHKIILKILRRLIKPINIEHLKVFLEKIKEEFIQTNYKIQWGGDLLLLWIESKIQQKPLEEILKKAKN